jgi:hypothetical protein
MQRARQSPDAAPEYDIICQAAILPTSRTGLPEFPVLDAKSTARFDCDGRDVHHSGLTPPGVRVVGRLLW